jgi:glycosyltransferase involved in cell wall biosynthesis
MRPNYFDVKTWIQSLKIEQKVITTGMVVTAEVQQILNGSDILCVPQNNSNFNLAGVPTKLAEYSATGKAVIISEIGDINRYFKHLDNAYLTEPSSVESLTKGLQYLVDNQSIRSKLSENILKTATQVFDYKVNGRKLLNIIAGIKK